ncbi:MAG: UDP-N-acetylmuramoyl-tripeptide--D-alanyl-D-alanine ligase [bacterium]
MMKFELDELLSATGGEPVGGPAKGYPGVTIDTRRVRPGELFVAIRGERFDGHHFVDDAVAAGAGAVVVSDRRFLPRKGGAVVVADTRRALGDLAATLRARLSCRVVAVTGSNGKTTVRSMLASLAAGRWRTVEAEANYNNDIGVPLTVFRLDESSEVGVFEVEMNENGGTRRLAQVCRPSVGVVTNVGDSHLEMMGDRDGVAREKAELLEELPADGVAVLNADDPLVVAIGRKYARCRQVTFGLERPADVTATDIVAHGLAGTSFRLNDRLAVRLAVPGRHNVANALAACAAAAELGLPFAAMPAVLGLFETAPGRLRVRRLGNNVTLIDDSYNANPQSMTAAIDLLCRNAPEGKRVAFLGDMLELGSIAMEAHTRLGVRAVNCLDRVSFVGRLSQHALAVAIRQGLAAGRVRLYPDSVSAAAGAVDMVRPGDTILVKGSHSVGMELIVKTLLEHHGEEPNQVH